jgi:hypothetical protein
MVKQIHKDIDHTVPPPGFRLPPEAWQAIDVEEQRYISRRTSELLSGTAIYKDRMMRRPDRCEGGFHALHLLEQRLHYLKGDKGRGRLEDDIAALKSELEDDAKTVEHRFKRNEGLEPYEEHAAAQGMTLREYITKCRKIEQALYRAMAAREAGDMDRCSNEFMDALCQIADWIGFDPVQVLMSVIQRPRNGQASARVH